MAALESVRQAGFRCRWLGQNAGFWLLCTRTLTLSVADGFSKKGFILGLCGLVVRTWAWGFGQLEFKNLLHLLRCAPGCRCALQNCINC